MRCGLECKRYGLICRLAIGLISLAVWMPASSTYAEAPAKRKPAAAKPAAAKAEAPKEAAPAEEAAKPSAEGRSEQPSVDSLFSDFLHYVKIGRFKYANDCAEALLARLDPKSDDDSVKLLELSERHSDSIDVLTIILANSDVGASARQVLERINKGRQVRRSDPARIKSDIGSLRGEPQQVLNATQRLQWSGEYAVPWMISALRDPAQAELHPRIIKALPKLGLPAVTPLCMALRAPEDVVRLIVIEALREIGYPHAAPYLKQIVENEKIGQNVREAAAVAIARIEASLSGRSSASLFLQLANQYYANEGSVRADTREDESNVWYFRNNTVQADRVPREIFDEIMAMRCCEEALLLQPNNVEAQALWVAANFRREAHLGVADVASEQTDKACDKDVTRPKGYPRAIYFARSAGPRFNHMVLGRALKDHDVAVALGAITALAETAGESSLIGKQDVKQPLVEALTFPDSLVRIRAALALGRALPKTKFEGSQEVIPVLAEALGLTGKRNVVVVDPDQENLNRVIGVLRASGFEAVGDAKCPAAMEKAQKQLPVLEGCFLATDLSEPDLRASLADIRKQPGGKNLPVILLTKERHMAMAEEIVRADQAVGSVLARDDKAKLTAEWQSVNRRVGRVTLNAEIAAGLSMASAATLRLIAASHSEVLDVARAEGALVIALGHKIPDLRILAAQALAVVPSDGAQQAIAKQALDEATPDDLRIEMFAALAESGRGNGSKLTEGQLNALVNIVMKEKKLPIRTAASAALGALNVPGNRASEILRAQYGG